MRGAFKTNDGWFEAKRKGSKGSSKESSLKSSASTASANSGLQVEKMKKIIREEGRNARNLLYYNVPQQPSGDRCMRPVPIFGRSKSETRISSVEHMSHGGGDMRRLYDQAKTDIRARANAKKWQFLIDNLKKAVDQIYATCEKDESVEECKEVVLYLKAYLYDVEKLQERILLQRDPTFEQKLPIRGIAWEVRKTSPAPRKLEEIRAKTPRSPRDRLSNRDKKNPQNTSNGAQTWADRLKGKSVSDTSVLPKPSISPECDLPVPKLDLDDVKDFNENMSMQSPIEDFDWADDIIQQDDCQYREPGRLATLHETLMSPSRKNPEKNSESYRELIESRQKEAQQRREEIQREKTEKVRKQTEKVEKAQRNQKKAQQRAKIVLEEKLKQATAKRNAQQQDLKIKAQDESQKVKEVNFINELEIGMKRAVGEKKIKKYEEKTEKHTLSLEEQKELKAKENEERERSVIARKRRLEFERKTWLSTLSQKRQDKTSLISEKLEKEKNAKIAALKSKEKRHEEYINAKRQQEKKDAQESKEKIKAKQIEAERRRLEELEKRKERAQDMSRCVPVSPRSNIDGQKSNRESPSSTVSRKLNFASDREDFDSPEKSVITAASQKKTAKKKLKKIRSKVENRYEQFEVALNGDSPPASSKGKMGKLIGDIKRQSELQLQEGKNSIWSANRQAALERSLADLSKVASQSQLGDVLPLTQAISCLLQIRTTTPKCLALIVEVIKSSRPIQCASLMCSAVPFTIIDLVTSTFVKYPVIAESPYVDRWCLLDSLAWLMTSCTDAPTGAELAHASASDVISHALQSGFFDSLWQFATIECSHDVLSAAFAFLTASLRVIGIAKPLPFQDDFIAMLERTELLGGVSVLYGSIVLEQNSDNLHGGIKLSPAIERTTMLILRSINSAATLSIETMQRILGQELLQVRSVIACLLTSMVPEAIRHESILAIGYFVMGNKDNQLWVHQGEQPTILNQLCMLPFQYFSEPELKGILFPTLVSSLFLCDEAKEIVRNEISLIHMASYLTDSIEQVTSESETLNSESEKWRLKNVDRWLLYHRFHKFSLNDAIEDFLSFTAT